MDTEPTLVEEEIESVGTPAAATAIAESPTEAPETVAETAEVEVEAAPAKEAPKEDAHFKDMAKALQKVQQDVAMLVRKKEQQGGDLTPAQQAKLDAAHKVAGELAGELKDFMPEDVNAIDAFSGVKKLSQVAVKLDERLRTLESENRSLKAKSQEVIQQTEYFEAEEARLGKSAKELRQTWRESIDSALTHGAIKVAKRQLSDGTISQTAFDEILNTQASELYHQRIARKVTMPAASTARPAPIKATPSGTRATQSPGASSASPDDNAIMRLIEEKLSY